MIYLAFYRGDALPFFVIRFTGTHYSRPSNNMGQLKQADGQSSLDHQPSLFRIFKVVYFVFFGSLGVIQPTFPVFFETVNHFTKYQIGFLQMIPNAIAFFVSPFMAAIADRYESSQSYIFVYSLIIATVFTMAMLLTQSFILSIALVLLTSIARASVHNISSYFNLLRF